MNVCLQLLLYVTVATKSERVEMRTHWRYQRHQWVRRHIIDDYPVDENGREIEPVDEDEQNGIR